MNIHDREARNERRREYAKAAMQAYLTDPDLIWVAAAGELQPSLGEVVAKAAFMIADAMLEAEVDARPESKDPKGRR